MFGRFPNTKYYKKYAFSLIDFLVLILCGGAAVGKMKVFNEQYSHRKTNFPCDTAQMQMFFMKIR